VKVALACGGHREREGTRSVGVSNFGSSEASVERAPFLVSDLDAALGAQLIVAWAGERGDEEQERLGWWSSYMVSEFGGEDLFQRLLPKTWRWAVFQTARELARRKDAECRQQHGDADRILSLFNLGFELDERIEERLQALKRGDKAPHELFVALDELATPQPWRRDRFAAWVEGHGSPSYTQTSIGRRLTGPPPADLGLLVRRLVGGLAPLGERYPLPYFMREAR
jgi:hypothetical protein